MAQLGGVSAMRYATAFFELAQERGAVEAYDDVAAALLGAFETTDLRAFLTNAGVKRADKLSAVKAAFGGGLPADFEGLMGVAFEKKREGELPAILTNFRAMVRDFSGVADACVTSAFPLDDAEIARIASILSGKLGKKVEVTAEVDESLLGGVKILTGGKLYDGTIRHELDEIRKRLLSEKTA